MLILQKHTDKRIQEQTTPPWLFEARLGYFVSDIMQTLTIEDADEIASSLNRAFRACIVLNIPFSRNFKRVYRFDGTHLIADWKISSLACYLIVINCNPANEHVAKAQLYFAMNNAAKR